MTTMQECFISFAIFVLAWLVGSAIERVICLARYRRRDYKHYTRILHEGGDLLDHNEIREWCEYRRSQRRLRRRKVKR